MKTINWPYPYVINQNNKNGINLVFCHGFNSSHGVFYPIVSHLKNVNYYSFTLPGNNLTPAKPDQLNMEFYAKEICNFIDVLDLKDVYLIGHSMGAGNAALVYKLIKQKIKKIAFIAPMNKSNLVLKELYYNNFFPKTPKQMLDFFTIYEYDKNKYKDQKWLKWAEQVFDYEYFNNENIVKLGDTLPKESIMNKIEEGLKVINIPSMLILGERDGIMMKQETKQYFKSLIKNIEIHEIPLTGHLIYTENKEEFLKVFEPFLLN